MDLAALPVPLVAAPMAGGPSGPELVAAVGEAGGLGFLAGGYRSTQDLAEQVRATRGLTSAPFGVNLFVPAPLDRTALEGEVQDYRRRLEPIARELEAALPEPDWDDTDGYQAKLEVLVQEPVPLVSFTFGVPRPGDVQRLREAGSTVAVTVTDADEALSAMRAGAQVLCVQGEGAGGHRGTHDVRTIPNGLSTREVLQEVRSVTAAPLIAAGGVATALDARLLLDAGAVAVQCGTAFLRCPEAGTSTGHRAALDEPTLDRTVVTRAWSGRPARGLATSFIAEQERHAPSAYPVVDQLTKPIRAAAGRVGDTARMSLWAGTGWQRVPTGTAAQVMVALTP